MVQLDNLSCIKKNLPYQDRKRPLHQLAATDCLHGRLIMKPNGRDELYNFAYRDHNDVCIGQWHAFLLKLQRALRSRKPEKIAFPYPDQGDPHLVFHLQPDEPLAIITTWFIDDGPEIARITEQRIEENVFAAFLDDALATIQNSVLASGTEQGAQWLARQTPS